MANDKRNLIEDLLCLRVKWNPGSEYPLKAQAAWLEAVERAVEAESKVERLLQSITEKDREIERLRSLVHGVPGS
ncbi:hypothetical protein ACFQ88_00900 [Paenibacillus sp. NPDC056579]|uniref:hypothetical protein n=1 Tax=Paenibacillus sp. NPDC056579 TaxID=3345871 RepID=UPI003678D732